MHYYKRSIGDYRAATAHLSMVEHGAYQALLDYYYLHEKPIENPNETQTVFKRLRAETQMEKDAVIFVLEEFFELRDGLYFHRRCDAEIEKYREKSAKNRECGALGGRPTSRNKKEKSQETQMKPKRFLEKTDTVKKQNPNETQTTNQEPLTTNQEKEILRASREPASKRKPTASRPDEIPEQLWADWLATRKAKRAGPPTDTAMAGIRREAALAGISLEAAIREACERGWIGFKAAWFERDTKQCFDTGRKKTNEELTIEAGRRVAQRIYDSATPEERAEFDRTHGGKVFCLSSKI